MKRQLFFLFLAFTIVSSVAQINPVWTSAYNGKGDFSDKISSIALDHSGNIYLGGYTVRTGNSRDFLVIRMKPDGDTLWTRTFNGSGSGADEVNALAVDASNNVYVTGFQNGNGTGDDVVTIKYNSSGDTLWTRIYNYSANSDEEAVSIAVDNSGNVYVTGYSDKDPSPAVTNDDYLTIKYNANGQQQWVSRFNGTGNATDRSVRVLAGANGTCFVTGRSANLGNDDFVTIKYDGVGGEAWKSIYDGGNGNDRPAGMGMDANENIFVSGRSDNSSDDDYATVMYNASGVQQWVRIYDGTGSGNDRPTAVTADAVGNVYVTGQSDENATALKNYDFLTIKYDITGAKKWSSSYSGVGNNDDVPSAIVLDASGNVYVTGQTDADISATVNNDYATVKYNAAGAEQWKKTFNGSGNASDAPNAVVVDSAGNVYVGGNSISQVTMRDALSIKYDAGGTQQWVKIYSGQGDNSDNVNAVTMDAQGNTYLAGYTIEADQDRNMCTVKLNGAGDTLWVRKYNGTSGGADEAVAIAVDAAGNVFVAGFSKNSGIKYDYTTIKYSSGGDSLWVRKYNNPAANGTDKAVAMVIDASSNVYVTGYSDNDVSALVNDDYATVKYNSAGVQQWVQRFNGTSGGADRAAAIQLTTAGVVVTGRSFNGTNDDIVTIPYTSAGVPQTPVIYDSGTDDNPAAMCTDAAGNIYITGASIHTGRLDNDYVTLKYNSSLAQQWVKNYDGTGKDDDKAVAVTTDVSGNVYMTGRSDGDTSLLTRDYNYVTIKYDLSGVQKWVAISGNGKGDDEPQAIGVDGKGYVFVTGQADSSTGLVRNTDYLTVGYNTSGAEVWKAVFNGTGNAADGANTLAIQGSSLIVSGGSFATVGKKDAVTLKYDITNVGMHEAVTDSRLLKIYPNPITSEAIIDLPGTGFGEVEVRFYNILGETVRRLAVNGEKKVTFKRDGLEQGVYFYQVISSGAVIQTGKLIIQ